MPLSLKQNNYVGSVILEFDVDTVISLAGLMMTVQKLRPPCIPILSCSIYPKHVPSVPYWCVYLYFFFLKALG